MQKKKKKTEAYPDIPQPDKQPEIKPAIGPEEPIFPAEPEIVPETEPDEPSPDEIPGPEKENRNKKY
jgi:hypothetical protein